MVCRPAAAPVSPDGARGAAVVTLAGAAAVPPGPPTSHVEPIANVNANSVTNPNAQAGFAAEDETQGEPAFVGAEARDQVDPAVTTLLGGVMAAAAGAAALRSRAAPARA